MLRAISEMAVAITIRSTPAKPSCSASSRPCWRAATMSRSCSTRITASPSRTNARTDAKVREPLLQVESRRRVAEREAELDHRESHVGLDADDDRLCPLQLEDVDGLPQHSRRERVDDV